MSSHKEFGAVVTRLIGKGNLTESESYEAFRALLANETSDLQQGAFLASLSAKGETEDEIAGAWRAIYDLDTEKARDLDSLDPVENCGTGMDGHKTFNVSTAAALVAAGLGVPMARHGARALTSTCGTVDLAEALGVDVECPVALVGESVRSARIGLFNGMSPEVHPKALGRILSQIHFGSTLNVAASLANPAMPRSAVRGVHSAEAVERVARVMRRIGYGRALVLSGGVDGSPKSMDEASVSGVTSGIELLADGTERRFSFRPEEFGLGIYPAAALAPEGTMEERVVSFLRILAGKGERARTEIVALNAGLILYVADRAASMAEGTALALSFLASGEALAALGRWVSAQNRDPVAGRRRLEKAMKGALS